MKTRIQKEIKQWREIKNDEFRELILDPKSLNKSIHNFCMKDIMSYINYREKELIKFFNKELNKSGRSLTNKQNSE